MSGPADAEVCKESEKSKNRSLDMQFWAVIFTFWSCAVKVKLVCVRFFLCIVLKINMFLCFRLLTHSHVRRLTSVYPSKVHQYMFRAIQNVGFTFAISFALLSGCAKDEGRVFIGDWVGVKSPKYAVTISRNDDDGYMIRLAEPSLFNGKLQVNNLPATLQHGMLNVTTGGGAFVFSIDKSSGHLINTNGLVEYRRIEAR